MVQDFQFHQWQLELCTIAASNLKILVFIFRFQIPRTLPSVDALRLAGAPGLPETRMTVLLTTSAEGLPVGPLRENQTVSKPILMLNNRARDERRKKTGSSKPGVRRFRVREVKSEYFWERHGAEYF